MKHVTNKREKTTWLHTACLNRFGIHKCAKIGTKKLTENMTLDAESKNKKDILIITNNLY